MSITSLPQQQEWPDWLIPPPRGYTADDFLKLQGLPPHTQLIDGSLVFASPQDFWHGWANDRLKSGLAQQRPADLRASREMLVRLASRQVFEPDIVVFKAEAADRARDRTGPSTYLMPADVVLVVEVVSQESEIRDREIKPRRYAAAGIRHFWRVERDGPDAVVYVYELEPATGAYALTGIHHDNLVLQVPFKLSINLTRIDDEG